MGIIYSIGVFLYGFLVRIAALFSSKAKAFVKGRRNWSAELSKWKKKCKKPIAWIHCSSLGEYEMARPLLKEINEQGFEVLITFFSPSGYRNFKKNEWVSNAVYLPLDKSRNAQKFLDILEPEMVIFVKYDLWFNYIAEIQKRQIPLYLVNGLFRSGHYYFKPYADWFLRKIARFTHLFLIEEGSAHLLNKKGIDQTTVTGDLRYDRVAEICANAPSNPIIEQFKADQKLVIGGSSWQAEEKILKAVSDFFPDQKILIAPHDISKGHIKEIRQLFPKRKCTTYSLARKKDLSQYQILIIDNIGMLSSAYQYADLAIVGGAFGKGLHNILEAATFGVPLYFGPNIRKFPQALEMVDLGLAHSISEADEFIRAVDRMNLEDRSGKKEDMLNFMQAKQGAAEQILLKLFHS